MNPTPTELLLIVPREVFEKYRFDVGTCYNWHLYGTDYCLSMLTTGKGVYVIPLYVIHKSKGASSSKLSLILNFGLSSEYYRSLKKVLNKHKDRFMWVYTTPGHGRWKTTEPLFTQRLKYSVIEMIKWLIVRIKSLLKEK